MSDLLHRLALEPRTSNVSVQDSVLVNGSEELSRSVKVPVISQRPSRKPPKIPELLLKARPLIGQNEDNWIEAFNADFG